MIYDFFFVSFWVLVLVFGSGVLMIPHILDGYFCPIFLFVSTI